MAAREASLAPRLNQIEKVDVLPRRQGAARQTHEVAKNRVGGFLWFNFIRFAPVPGDEVRLLRAKCRQSRDHPDRQALNDALPLVFVEYHTEFVREVRGAVDALQTGPQRR